jgi:lipid-binding SYLF domain-containing protein
MKTLVRVVLFAITLSNVAFAAEAASSRLQASATVLNEIMAAPDKGIPSDILSSAKCVAVVPSLLKGGFVVGGAHGRGMATCRTATGWSAPAPLTTTGGSIGLQIGGQAVDLVMVIMNDRGMQRCYRANSSWAPTPLWLPVLWGGTPKALRIGNCALKC